MKSEKCQTQASHVILIAGCLGHFTVPLWREHCLLRHFAASPRVVTSPPTLSSLALKIRRKLTVTHEGPVKRVSGDLPTHLLLFEAYFVHFCCPSTLPFANQPI